MMPIYLFNTLTKKVEEFLPIETGKVGMYCCGPTVYNYAHIGNYRTYLFEDVLRRMLQYNGYEVKQVMNVTDVGHLTSDGDFGEDKIEKGSRLLGMTAWELVKVIEKAFLEDFGKLNIMLPDVLSRATEHIPEQIEMVKILEEKGYLYRTQDGLYFDVAKWSQYGILSGQKLEDKMAGIRVELNEEKRNPCDFAVWKFSPAGQQRQMEWDSPWGIKGFPGWHIECSAMSMKYLGQHFDIHCGGVDHIAVHHENEIAQSEASNGQKYVNYWLHGEFMMVEGKRMGKSEGNAYLISDLMQKGFDPLAYRYLNIGTHYRIQLNFTWDGLKAADTALGRLRNQVSLLKEKVAPGVVDENFKANFLKAINQDLNTSEALSLVWDVLKSDLAEDVKLATVLDFDRVLGLKLDYKPEVSLTISDEVQSLLEQRKIAREQRNFAESDRLRNELNQAGFQVKDTANGQELSKI